MCGPRHACWSAVGLVLALSALQGCSYVTHRYEDLGEVVDLGVTLTTTPYLSVYGCFASVGSAGAGRVDGTFVGIGGSQIGMTRHYHRKAGLVLWSYEEFGWAEFDPEKPETLDRQHIGLVGWLTHLPRRPAYAPA